jgi:hypothetical protein
MSHQFCRGSWDEFPVAIYFIKVDKKKSTKFFNILLSLGIGVRVIVKAIANGINSKDSDLSIKHIHRKLE